MINQQPHSLHCDKAYNKKLTIITLQGYATNIGLQYRSVLHGTPPITTLLPLVLYSAVDD